MAKKRRGKANRHRLLVYFELGQQLRTPPLLIAIMGLVLLGIGWLGRNKFVPANQAMANAIWDGQIYIWAWVIVATLLYLFTIYMGRRSYVEVRGRALRVQAGLIRVDISYKRIRQIRPISIESQYPTKEMKNRDYNLIEPYLKYTATGIDLKSWPWPGRSSLRRLWHKFMFMSEKASGLMLIVEDGLVLNTQIDTAKQRRANFDKQSGYVDPIDRAFDAQKRS